LKGEIAASTTFSVNSSEIQPATTPVTIITQTYPTPHTVMQTNTDFCHLLSNNTSRDSNSLPSRVVIDGGTYTLSYCDHAYSIDQNMQRPYGCLIYGGGNDGLRGSGVGVLAETFLTADVSDIADNTSQKVTICTVAGLIKTQHGPIIGVFHQYAHHDTCKKILSVFWLREFVTIIDNTPCSFGEK
jgi:hypothetical protein